jgi:DNA-binding transcriptional regulator YiaG
VNVVHATQLENGDVAGVNFTAWSKLTSVTSTRPFMPSIANVLKAEISRIARKEARAENHATRKASAQHRRSIAELRRQVASLRHDLAAALRKKSAPSRKPSRFTAKGLISHRARLGLSAGDYGRLVGVSAQSIYNWERESATPRDAQKAKLLTLRTLGAREARRQLDAMR